MSKRNTVQLDARDLQRMLSKLGQVGGNVKAATEKALQTAAEKVNADTKAAMAKPNLPAGGKYSTGATMQSIVADSAAEWTGNTAAVPVGFDFAKPGAGGFLITGTPRMRPNPALNSMFRAKTYMNKVQKEMAEGVLDEIMEAMTK